MHSPGNVDLPLGKVDWASFNPLAGEFPLAIQRLQKLMQSSQVATVTPPERKSWDQGALFSPDSPVKLSSRPEDFQQPAKVYCHPLKLV